jgi:hypothetical protein
VLRSLGHWRSRRSSPFVPLISLSVRQRDKVKEPRIELGLSDHFPGLDPVELDSGCG